MNQDRKLWKGSWVTVLGVLALLWLPVWLPIAGQLGNAFLGIASVDGYGTLWYYWHIGESLEAGQDPFTTRLFFHPYGKDIFADSGGNVVDALAAWPVRRLMGPVWGTNLFILGGLFLSGVSFYGLARSEGVDRMVAACGGGWFTVTPYALHEVGLGRPTQGLLALLPLFLFFALKVGRSTGWKPVLGAGLVLAVLGYQYWYYMVFSGLICAALGVLRIANPLPGAGSRREIAFRFASVAGVALLLAAPGIWMGLDALGEGRVVGLLDTSDWVPWRTPVVESGAERAGRLILWQPFTGFRNLPVDGQLWSMIPSTSLFLPWISLVGVGVWLGLAWRAPESTSSFQLRPRVWLAMVVMAMILAMGPVVLLGSQSLPNPVYLILLQGFEVMKRLWWPYRASAWIAVLVTLALTFSVSALGRRGLWAQRLGVIVVSLFIAGDLWLRGMAPFPTWSARAPAGYECLAQGGSEPIIELPYQYDFAHLYYQTLHGRPMMGGMGENSTIYEPAEIRKIREENAWLGALQVVTATELPVPEWGKEDRKAIQELGYRYVVVRLDAYEGLEPEARKKRIKRLRRHLTRLAGMPVYRDERTLIYSLGEDTSPCLDSSVQRDEEPREALEAHVLGEVFDQRGSRWMRP